MTRIDFYLLSDGGGAVAAACRLCEKAVSAGHRLYVHAPDPAAAAAVDGALWSFRQGGFVPHERHHPGSPIEDPIPPVLIGGAEPPDSHRSILVNLAEGVPAWFSSFERVLEVVSEDPARRAQSRDRYRYYKERGYELNVFEQAADGGWLRKTAA